MHQFVNCLSSAAMGLFYKIVKRYNEYFIGSLSGHKLNCLLLKCFFSLRFEKGPDLKCKDMNINLEN